MQNSDLSLKSAQRWLPLAVIGGGVSWYETTYAGTRVSFVMLCVLMIVLYLSSAFRLSRS